MERRAYSDAVRKTGMADAPLTSNRPADGYPLYPGAENKMAASTLDPQAALEEGEPLKPRPPRTSPTSMLVVFLNALLPCVTLADISAMVLLAALNVYVVLSLGGFFAMTGIGRDGRHPSPFHCDDPNLQSPFLQESIRTRDLIAFVVLAPPTVLIVVELRRMGALRDRCFWAGRVLRRFFVGLLVVAAVTQLLKDIVCEKRPYFLDACKPAMLDPVSRNMTPACDRGTSGKVVDYVCSGSPRDAYRAFESFPSGHASASCYTAYFMIGYVIWRADSFGALPMRVVFVSLLSAAAMAVSLSRIIELIHFWWDVAAGASLGVGMAAFFVLWPFS